MSADLTRRLRSATAEGRAPDTEAILARARQLRRRRRTLTATLGMLALVMVAVPILGQVRPPAVMLDGRGTPADWPIEIRYEIERFPAGGQAPVTEVHELGGTSWDEWTAVGVRAPGGDGQVLRFAHGSLYRGAVAVDDTAGEPFATLARARGLDLHDDDLLDERLVAHAPNDVMNLRFATARSPDGAHSVVDEDLPDLRAQVGAELGLDPDALLAQRVEEGCDSPPPAACYELVYVALAAARIPLYAEEIHAEVGLESRLRVTHLRAPDPPDAPQGPVAVLDLPPVGETRAEWLDDATPVFVTRHDDGQVSVVLALSTHTTERGFDKLIGWCASSRTFDDVQHGSQWNARGTYISGPAPGGLVTFAAAVRDGGVHVGARQPPHPRAAGPGDRHPVAPSCVRLADGPVTPPGFADHPTVVFHEAEDAPLAVTAPDHPPGQGPVLVEGTAVFRPGYPVAVCSTLAPGPDPVCPRGSPTVTDAAAPDQPGTRTLTGAFLARRDGADLRAVAVLGGAEFTELALPLAEVAEDAVSRRIIRGRPVFVALEGDAVTVFLARTPHLDDEDLWWCSHEAVFASPAHGELFGPDGTLWDGPGERGLDRYPVRVEDGVVLIDPSRVIEGEPRPAGADAAGLLDGDALQAYRNPPWSDGFCRDALAAAP